VDTLPLFDPRKENETYQQEREELMGVEWITSTSTAPSLYGEPMVYDIPLVYDHYDKQSDEVSTLKRFLRSFLDLMKDESM
jgi:hypothetical protein